MQITKATSLMHLLAAAAGTARRPRPDRRRKSEAQRDRQPALTARRFHEDSVRLSTIGVTVGPSPVTVRPQEVRVRYIAEFFHGARWVGFEQSSTMSAEVSGSGSATFGPWRALKPLEVTGTLGFRVVCKVSWHDVPSQRVLAVASVTLPDHGGDRTRV